MNRLALIVTLIAAFLVVLIGPAAFLSWRLGEGVRRDLRAESASVRVVAGPLGIAGGRIARLSVQARGAAVDGMPLDEVRLDLRRVTLDSGRAFQGDLVVRTANGTAVVSVREESLARHLVQARGFRGAAVRMDGGTVTITGKVPVLNALVDVTVRTRLVVRDDRHLALDVEQLQLSGLEVPPDVARVLVMSINPLLTAPQRPVPLRFTGVTVDDGRAVIAAAVAR